MSSMVGLTSRSSSPPRRPDTRTPVTPLGISGSSSIMNIHYPQFRLAKPPMVKTGLMTDADADRVAVYLDFDNIVISRYDQVNGRSSFQKDKAKGLGKHADRLDRATGDVGAIIDFASSFGTLVLTRAYAGWSGAG